MPRSRRTAASRTNRLGLWRLFRLEDRLTPAVAFVGPHGVPELNMLEQTSATSWTVFGAKPAPAPDKVSYFDAPHAWYFQLDSTTLQQKLESAPWEFTADYSESFELAVPRPDGSFQSFHVWEVSIMEPGLAAQFPDIHTYRGQGIDDPTATLAMDVTGLGFHAQVLSAQRSYYVDPYYHLDQSVYLAYYKTDLVNHTEWNCLANATLPDDESCGCSDGDEDADGGECPLCDAKEQLREENYPFYDGTLAGKGQSGSSNGDGTGGFTPSFTSNGATLRTYRAAVAADAEYTAYFGGTVAAGQAAVVTAMNRVDGVYETELGVRMVLVANNNSLIYTDSASDPYTDGNGPTMLGQNQTNIDTVIGTANYDIGHVFSTGGGGIAGLGVVTVTNQKARGVTGSSVPETDGYWIDYVAHEMGHEFGGNHTFNSSLGSCGGGNRNASTAYEQGSGNTIMAYAGICSTDDLQPHSDAYFHSASLDEISTFIASHVGNINTATGNNFPTALAGLDRTIPANTPFVLTGAGVDPNGDAVTYAWEERDLGASTTITAVDNGTSPLYRPFNPTTSPTQYFPDLASVLSNNLSPSAQKLPTTNRTLNYRLVVRDNKANGGAFNSDDLKLTVVNTGSAFAVTSPNTAVSWTGNASQTVTWDVAGTTANGINAATVDILLSTDGGLTFGTVLASGVANDGSESITVPNSPTTQARIKVQPVGNVFYDVSNVNFTIKASTGFNVVSTTPTDGSLVTAPLTTIDFTFAAAVDENSIGTSDITVSKGTVVGAALQSANTVRYTLSGLTSETPLSVNLSANSVLNTSAVGNDAFAFAVTLDIGTVGFVTPLTQVGTAGSLNYNGTATGTINTGTDTDSFTIDLDAGQTAAVLLTPSANLRGSVTLTGPGVNQTVSSSANGTTALLQTVAVATAGTFTLTVGSVGGTTGTYSARLDLNAALESEGNGGTTNDTTATAQAIGSFFDLGNGATRATVRGKSDSGGVLPTEVEPNNTTATANDAQYTFLPFSSNLYHLGITASISSATDTDYFNIGAMQVGDIITVSQAGSHASRGTNANPQARIYRAGATGNLVSNDNGGVTDGTAGDALIYRFTVTTADTYYIRAIPPATTPTGSYQFAVYLENTSTAPTTGGTFTAEVEANETKATADDASTSWRAVQYRSQVTGSITAGDVDDYSFQFTAGDLVTLFADSTSTLETRVALKNSAGTTIALEDGSSTGPGNDSPIYAFRIPTTGTYFVETKATAGTGTYTNLVYLSTTAALPTPPSGVDFYSFPVTAGQPLALGLKSLTGGNIDVTLVDDLGTSVANGSAGATNFDETLNFTPATAGTWFAKITGAINNDYQLTISRGTDLDIEANDSFATAQPLVSNNASGSISGSDDYYQIALTAGQIVTLSTTTPCGALGEFVNNLDPVISLYDPSGALMGTNDNSGSDGKNAVLTKSILQPGTYRVQVNGASGSTGEYTLNEAVSNDPPPQVVGTPVIDDGTDQRSEVRSITVVFSEVVTLPANPADAFTLIRDSDSSVVNLTAAVVNGSATTVTLTFAGALTDGPSLADGRFTLTVLAPQVVDSSNQPLAANTALALHRLFGDTNGDAKVDAVDFGAFRAAFNSTGPTPPYSFSLDFNNDNKVDAVDFGAFRARFNTTI